MSVRAPAERRFRRANVRPGRRRSPWRTLAWRAARYGAVALVVLYAGYRAFVLVLNAEAFQVNRISVHGNVRLSSGEVEALVHGLYGTSLLRAELHRYRQRLLDSPWVAGAALRRVLPSTVEIFVSERRPVGICRLRHELYLVDREGTLIDQFGPQYAQFDLPIIDGLVRAPSEGKPVIDERRIALASRVIEDAAQVPEIAGRISQIDVTDVHDAVVLLEQDPALLHLGEERFLERIRRYVEVADALHERVEDIDYVDLRFDERLYVGPRRTRGARPADRPARARQRF